jgi:hypothetical protein
MNAIRDMQTALNAPSTNIEYRVNERDVLAAQRAWRDAILDIGLVYADEQDYRYTAEMYLSHLYAFEQNDVLFYPAIQTSRPVRSNFEEILSFFVCGVVHEDTGFALRPWQDVTFTNQAILPTFEGALVMGHCTFIPTEQPQQATRTDFSMAYVMTPSGRLKIQLQHMNLSPSNIRSPQ